MGMLVAFWSPLHGRGTTTNCISTALQFSYSYLNNVYITHTHYTRSIMETAFLNGNEDEDLLRFADVGIDSIERALETGNLKAEDFKSYCNKITSNFYLLAGSKKLNYDLFNKSIGQTFEKVCRYAKEADGVTFVDVESGFTKEIANKVLDLADVIVVNLDQTNYLCEEYFNQNNTFNIDVDKEIIVIGRFDWESKYTKKYIEKTFNVDCYTIPQVTELLDAMNNHRVHSFFRENYIMQDVLFFDELNGVVEEIANRALEKGLTLEKREKFDVKKKKKLLSIFNI